MDDEREPIEAAISELDNESLFLVMITLVLDGRGLQGARWYLLPRYRIRKERCDATCILKKCLEGHATQKWFYYCLVSLNK
jgi:hypothetical protein